MVDRTHQEFQVITKRIWDNLSSAGFRGSDPYDGLNSQLLAPVLKHSRLARLVIIQGVKRAPFNLRPLLRIPPGLNPKGLALMLQGAAEWTGLGDTTEQRSWLTDAVLCLASNTEGRPALANREVQPGTSSRLASGQLQWPDAVGWGYDFPWQSKAFLQPAFSPTVVATSFVIDGLEWDKSPAFGPAVISAGCFVAEHLNCHQDKDGLCFSYSPEDNTRVYNASLFGARILAQALPHVPDFADTWRNLAISAVDWVMARQKEDGSWIYGDADHWQWIDNLHTGFNLETINRVAELLETDRWDDGLARGLAYYRKHLFEEDATPRYYSTTRWPIDPHSFAQGALTFIRLGKFDPEALPFAEKILQRGIEELWDDKNGGFRFQKHPGYSQGTIHMRWSQAWMFRSFCAYLAAV